MKSTSELEHARLLPRLSWSWTVLLPSGTHREHIKSITAVLLPFVTCLLTLPRIFRSPLAIRWQQFSTNVLADYVWLSLVSSKQTMRVRRRILASAKCVHESFKSASVVTLGRVGMLRQVQPSGRSHGHKKLQFRIVVRTYKVKLCDILFELNVRITAKFKKVISY
jgi:hypothetical protein